MTRGQAITAALVLATLAGAFAARAGDAPLSGRDIYARVLENRFAAFTQTAQLLSADAAGNTQRSEFEMRFRDESEPAAVSEAGVLSRSLVRYTQPFDLRHSGYLVIHKGRGRSDQFVYRNSQRQVRRVSLRGENVFGTDFSFEDVIPRELDDATYERLADVTIDDLPCYLVRAVPVPEADSEYTRFEIAVDRARFVPIRTRYWDRRGIEIKRLDAAPAHIREMRGVYVPMRSTMQHLRAGSSTVLEVLSLDPDAALDRRDFDLRRLAESH